MTDPEQSVDVLPLMDMVERGQVARALESDQGGLSERQKGPHPVRGAGGTRSRCDRH